MSLIPPRSRAGQEKALPGPQAVIRRWAALALAVGLALSGCAGPRVARLVKNLSHPDQKVRLRAARDLRAAGPAAQEAAPALVQALRDPSWPVQIEVARALIQLGEPVVPELVLALQSPAAALRCRSADVLGDLGPAAGTAVPALIPLLKVHDACFPAQASESLAKIGLPAVTALVAALNGDDWILRQGAADAISRMDPAVRGDAAAPFLRTLVGGTDAQQEEAAKVLGSLGLAAVPGLVPLLRDASPTVRYRALTALGEIGPDSPDALEAVAAVLKDSDRTLRLRAAAVLGQAGAVRPAAAKSVSGLLGDRDARIRGGAAEALGIMGPAAEDYVEALVALLEDPDGEVREEAAEALIKIGTVPALRAARAYRAKRLGK